MAAFGPHVPPESEFRVSRYKNRDEAAFFHHFSSSISSSFQIVIFI